MRLAVFDLDHTLIPFDSGLAWFRFLIAEGAIDAGFEASYLGYARQYVDGTIDFPAWQRFLLAELARHEPARLLGWRHAFAATLPARLPAAARELVRRHLDAGDAVCIATATTRFIAEPFARGFGVAHLVASEAERDEDGAFSGELEGEPCFAAAKARAVNRWAMPFGGRAAFERIVAYSDSRHDLPLLEWATHPVAVGPDKPLRAVALERGWPVIERPA